LITVERMLAEMDETVHSVMRREREIKRKGAQ
jgi:hypothetical protein